MLERISDTRYRIARHDGMRVDAEIVADARLITQIESDRTIEQIENVAHLPGLAGPVLTMPDAHQGYGFPIGGVAAMDIEHGVVSPGGIGYDINCGVRLLASDLSADEIRPRMKELVDALFEQIPCGAGRDGALKLSPADLDHVLREGAHWAIARGYGAPHDLEHCEANGRLTAADPDAVTHAAKQRGKNQLGTLGSGNHFVEVQRVSEVFDTVAADAMGLRMDQIVVLLHSGSRGLGHQTCSDHLEKMESAMRTYKITLPDRELACAPIRSREGETYLRAMQAAANYAFANRQMITHAVRKVFTSVFGTGDLWIVYDVCHNIAKVEDHVIRGEHKRVLVHRKGATRAFGPGHAELPADYRSIGQPVIIPGSMGTRSYVLVGTEHAMQTTYGSTCHGAGRRMSRTKAKAEMTMGQLVNDMQHSGIIVRGASRSGLLEEIPQAYKNVDDVVDVVHRAGISTKVASLAPLGVIKG